ncbi:CLUMA_CG018852, isoform A [Clunio marinus]|uniref:CLUMA_CG018852, isoform A n=1 Tax=Clunio marinus TaxID=568069 RepID=A0A1J1J4M2_9DIPT|nr:CLUMA_CG018852, isoform A [Clunio marinus]
MFKIENYIAPLILSKLEKFVKNIDQNEFQLSLWQGDVIFQNLELKLDVLEDELQLPFTFLSGHINDLKIQIPWTKIASEPIIITINTIELVVKLKDFSAAPTVTKPKLKKKISIDEDAQAGYMASLITKILNNISVICNNIVLKFIEEDIVISMNIQHLSVHSADHRWKRAFIDVSPTNVLFRKLINIIDLTICLDKRNSSGKIESVQEPILYKCSMELRLYRKFNATTPAKLSLTRIDIQTNALNLSISSQQFPMLMRLYDIIMALKSGRLQAKYAENLPTQPTNDNQEANDDESWLLWAWNMIPAILPDEESNEPLETSDKKIFEFGFYAEDINLTLKAQEFLTDPIIPSTKKAIFKPLLGLHIQEFYNITIISGVRKFNVKCGVGFAEVSAMEECACGVFVTETQLITAGNKEKSGNYLKDSFMDKTAASMQEKYEDIWSNYYEKNNEEIMLSKTTALALDILHSVEIPDDARSSDVGSDLEFSNLSESYVIRVFGSGYVVHAGADLVHRIERIVQYYKDCDFLPYVEEEKPLMKNQLSPATADDYDALINEVPLKIVQLKLKNLMLVIKEWDHEKPSKSMRKLTNQGSFVGIIQKKSVTLEMKIDEATMELKLPLYRNRLIYTACQLPDDINNELFDKCFFMLSVALKNIKIDMKYEQSKRIVEVLSVTGRMRRLIYPHLWIDKDIQENLYEVGADGFSLMINPPQLIALQVIISSMIKQTVERELERDVLRNLGKIELVVLQLSLQRIKMKAAETTSCLFVKFVISDLLGIAWKSGTKSLIINWPDNSEKSQLKPSNTKKKIKKHNELMIAQIQYPKVAVESKLLPVLTMKLSEGSINLDPLLREFLSFQVVADEPKTERFARTISSSTKLAINNTSSNNNQLPSAQSSSDGDLTICPVTVVVEKEAEVDRKHFNDLIDFTRNLIVNVEVKPLTIFYTKTLLETSKPSDSLQALLSKNDDHMMIVKMPTVIFHSVKNRSMSEMISRHFTAELPSSLWGNEKAFTWNFLLSCLTTQTRENGKVFNLIEDFSLNVSIADESTSNPEQEKIFFGNLLIETSPVIVSMYTSQLSLIKAAIDEITNLHLLFQYHKLKTVATAVEKPLSVIQESPQNTSEIKEFLGLATGSTTTKTSHGDDKSKKTKTNYSLYLQWICSKITLILIADVTSFKKKLVLELDELLFSLHQHDFYQLKSKIASISGNFYECNDDNDVWTKNITLGLNIQSDENISDNANRFLDVTITKAETVNVHSRWNVGHKRNRLYNDDITEINVVIQPLDVIANFDELIHFLPIFSAATSINSQKKETSKRVENVEKAGSDLPLIHVMCSGFRIFMPCLSDNQSSQDVLIVKIINVQVTPTAVNNLIRNQILRPDIHSKACSLGILDLAGSKIEDRQYQLTVKGVSLSTSNWEALAALITDKPVIESHDNPAFEWNNLENGPKSPNFKLTTIFKDSNFSFIYAPSIRFKQTLVAGTAMEFNCVNDMNIEMTLKDVALLMNLSERMRKIFKVFHPSKPSAESSKVSSNDKESKEKETVDNIPIFEKRKPFEKKSLDDSGVGSISQSHRAHERKLWKKKSVGAMSGDDSTNVPFEFTFTSSKFKLRCTCDDENELLVVLDTPNIFITQDKYEKSMNLSLHDLFVMHGMEKIFSTRDGIQDLSGIKPSLVRVKFSEKSMKNFDCDVNIKRPMAIEFSHEKLSSIFHLFELLKKNSIVKESEVKKEVIQVKRKSRKFDSIKSHFNDIRTLNFSTSQMICNVTSLEYDFKLAVSELKGKLKVFERPEKIEANFDVVNFMLINRSKIILHPLSVQNRVKIIQEYWKKDPMIHLNLNSNLIRVDVGIDVIKDVETCRYLFMKVLNFKQNETEENLTTKSSERVEDRKIPIHQNSLTNKIHSTIEHFQDDLRSGAFQFVETSSLRDLPLPYQIQIIDNEVGMICWRYPLPRALHKIKIFPVPFQTANQVTIICKIEFYSQIKSKFEEYCEFTLTENETKLLDLKQNRPSAEVWRIKIPRVFCKRDSDDDDDDNNGDYEFQMHPKVLVACLRIDSYYVSNAIPKVDAFVEVSHAEINLMNKMEVVEKLPEFLSNYHFMDDRGKEHEAVKMSMKNIKIYGQFFDENYENFEFDSIVGLNVIDYGCGNLVPLISDFRMKTLVDHHLNDVNLNVMTDKIDLKYAPAIGHSLMTTTKIWTQQLRKIPNQNLVIHTKFVICNNTANPIGINQFQTNEMICLMPQTFILYSFRTDKLEQSLQLCVCLKGLWSLKTKPMKIHQDGTEFVMLEENQFFVVTVKSLTNFQRKITIDGTVGIFNMTKELFRIQYKRYDKDIDAPDNSEAIEFDIDGHRSGSVFGTCMTDSQQSIRLRLVKNEKKVFSGEIPLREIVVNNKPWLVKVPSMASCGFTSYWVRIIRETKNKISRVLVMIWPMFVTKSLLPINTTVYEAEQNQSHVIIGRGETKELDMCGTHEDEHELLLKGNFSTLDDDVNGAKVMLSYKLINRNSFFKIPDEYSDINRAVEKFETTFDERWPCGRDEEFRVLRDVTSNGPTLPVYHLSSQNPEDLSCSLMLTLAPWCSIINSSGYAIKLINFVTKEVCSVDVNAVAMPFYINNSFTLSIEVDNDHVESQQIFINTDVKRSSANSSALPIEGQIPVFLQTTSEIIQLIITSSMENKMRLIIISSLIVVTNYSKYDLKIFTFVADVGEKLENVKRNEIHVKKSTLVTSQVNMKENVLGQPIAMFGDLFSSSKGKRKINTNFSSLFALGVKDDEMSMPIKIQPTLRKCVNVPNNIPISLSIIKHNEQYFISIFNDTSPFICVNNDTDFNLFIAQTDLSNHKYVLPHKEVADERFSWFQTIPSKQKVFYTPPIVNEHFPEIINQEFGLIFACVTGDDFVRWSQPIKIDGTKTMIINVPLFGDIKLNIDVQEKTVQLSICYIQNDGLTFNRTELSRDFYRAISQQSFLDINSNYQKTFSLKKATTKRAFNVNFYSTAISFTIYKDDDKKRTDLISLNADEICLKYSKLAGQLKMNFTKIQVDNELFPGGDYDFPVVLCNKDLPKISNHITISGTSIWDLDEILDSHTTKNNFTIDVDLYKNGSMENIVVNLQPIRVYIEDTFINVLLEIVDDCLPTNLIEKFNKQQNLKRIKLEDGMVLIPRSVVEQVQHLSEPLRLKSIRLEPLHILLSVHTCMRMYIALDHSPLDFSAYEKLDIYTLPVKLGNSMGMHYLSSAIFGAGWVVGSLEILGSPSGLARSFTSGLKDFVSMPAQGLLKGPWGFLMGLTHGSVSLVRNVTTGTVNSVTKLATSLARNLDRLTLDNDHIHLKTDASRRHRPQGLTEGLQQGLTGLGISILGAIGGLARHPLQATSTVEVFTGVGKGIVGVFAKPISGAAEFVALTGSGMLQSVGYNLLPLPISHHIENRLMHPTADKIISKQLSQHASTSLVLFTCHGSFSRKNDIKNSFIVLMSNMMVVADLDRDTVMDVIPLERIQPVTRSSNVDNLFVFKIKDDDESSPTNNEQKYSVSKRTVQYIQQLSGSHITIAERSSEENSEEETRPDSDDVESLSAIGIDKKISFYMDEVTGKYLSSYVNLMKSQIQSRNNLFPLFES